MSEIVLSAIAAERAKLVRLVDLPTPPHGFGVDLDCAQDFDDQGSLVTDPRTLISQEIVRRLTTRRGSAPNAPSDGIDVREWLSQGVDESTMRARAGQVRQELSKDDRIANARVELTAASSALRVSIRVTPASSSVAPFTLIFAASSAEILIEEISR